MKTIISSFSLIACLFSSTFLIGQSNIQAISHGGGEAPSPPPQNCLTDAERQEIEKNISINRIKLRSEGKLRAHPDRSSVIMFEWPVMKNPQETTYNNIWVINNFVDQQAGGGTMDWNCGSRTYDGHKGIDIVMWPFPWHVYDQAYGWAVAAAPGTIVFKEDGNEDDHCSCSCTNCWNAVYIEHADGSVTFYGHLKINSLTPKEVGETVETGEYLGTIASSGCSSVPHLHFEVYEDMPYIEDHLIDPFSGPCNELNAESWWADQMEYREPRINAVFTHDAVPIHGCPDISEHPNFENVFIPGETVYTAFYYKDQLNGTSASYQLLRPNGSVYNSWTQNFNQTYNSSWWYFSWLLPATGPFGTWSVTATYQGETVTHTFQYLEVPPQPGKIGINTTIPQAELHLHNGDLYIDDSTKGMILKDANGNCYRLKVNTSGLLVSESLTGCPD